MPSRGTAPGPATSPRYELFIHRMCPPTYTAVPLTLTLHDVSPPVQSVQVGAWFGPVVVSSNRLIESQSRLARKAPVVTTTK